MLARRGAQAHREQDLANKNLTGNLVGLNEILRIPIIDYATVFLLYGLYLLVRWLSGLARRPAQAAAGGD